jgi:DnaK suppressor protein
MTRSAIPAARGTQLSPPQLTVLRGMLEQQRRFRLDQLEQLQQSGPRSEADREISESLVAGAHAALRDVVDALQRMEDGRYGACRRCGTSLSPERLEVLPQVGLCMACQRAEQVG